MGVVDFSKLSGEEIKIIKDAKKEMSRLAKDIDITGGGRLFKAMPLSDRTSCIYFIEIVLPEGESFVKIGKADDVKNRIGALQVGCPFRMEVAYYFAVDKEVVTSVEGILHTIFKPFQYRGEWFVGSPKLGEWVNSHEEANKEVVSQYPKIKLGRLWGTNS